MYANEHSYTTFERCWVMPYLNRKYGITDENFRIRNVTYAEPEKYFVTLSCPEQYIAAIAKKSFRLNLRLYSTL
ncbi:MAG: hypothetical protein NC452_17250 [Eubacterium sp.]|nr:hypothetical protein [Eubacterium sp.]